MLVLLGALSTQVERAVLDAIMLSGPPSGYVQSEMQKDPMYGLKLSVG